MELGIESWRGRDPRVRSGTTPERALPETLSRVFPVVMLRVEVLDEDRWCLWEGTGWLGPERRWLALLSDASTNPAEVEEVLETTEAFWAALSKESSRVNRLTTASCSFSSCRCKSAAVNGRGCLKGPGPNPTPVLSPVTYPVVIGAAGILGEVKGGDVALTALWFEGRILREEGEAGGRATGSKEPLREVVRDVRRGED